MVIRRAETITSGLLLGNDCRNPTPEPKTNPNPNPNPKSKANAITAAILTRKQQTVTWTRHVTRSPPITDCLFLRIAINITTAFETSTAGTMDAGKMVAPSGE